MICNVGSTHLAVNTDTFSTLTVAIIDCECFAAVRDVRCREMFRETQVRSLVTISFSAADIDANLKTDFFGGAGGGGGGFGGGGASGGRGAA